MTHKTDQGKAFRFWREGKFWRSCVWMFYL